MVHANGLRAQIKDLDIRLALATRAKEIREDGIVAEDAEGEKFYPADTVVYAVGQHPLTDEAFALRFSAPEFYVVGDCIAPKNIMAATTAAYNAARDIGRL